MSIFIADYRYNMQGLLGKIRRVWFTHKGWLIWGVSGLVLLIVLLLLLVLSVRGKVLETALTRIEEKLQADYGLSLKVGSYGFSGFRSVTFDELSLTAPSSDRLLFVKHSEVSLSLLPLLKGELALANLQVDDAALSLVKGDSSSNYDFLFARKSSSAAPRKSDGTASGSLSEKIERVFNAAFRFIPQDMQFSNLRLSLQDSTSLQQLLMPEGRVNDGNFDIDVFLGEGNAKWNFSGQLQAKTKRLGMRISSSDEHTPLPFLENRFGLRVSFNDVYLHLDDLDSSVEPSGLAVKGGVDVHQLRVLHTRLSDSLVELPELRGSGGFLLTDSSISLLPGTVFQVKDFSVEPQLHYHRKGLLSMEIHTGEFQAQDFFDAIPKGLFEQLSGVQVKGKIAYDMAFKLDLQQPDSLVFTSSVKDDQLEVVHWGKADIAGLNAAFSHDIYEDTLLMRRITLGPGDPNFTPLAQIAPILRKTVLNTEDPFFYQHSGFELDAFRLSIATNIKQRSFKRGASTISMQLVKNLFLNRNKTMMRKFEEILLVWLMEHSHQVSKDRLLEICFNIIEWGPNVYGIKEAARYYFQKSPSELNLGESLFLSSIIPRPKTALSSFDYTGHLKPWLMRHFNTYGSILYRSGDLTNELVPEAYGFYQVLLRSDLRPPRPKGAEQGEMDHQTIKGIVEDMDQQEFIRRSLMERLLNQPDTLSDRTIQKE